MLLPPGDVSMKLPLSLSTRRSHQPSMRIAKWANVGFHPPWIPISRCIIKWSDYLLLLRWWNLWNQGMYVDNAYICMHVFMCIHKYVQWYVYNVWIIMYKYILLYDSMQCPYCHRDKSISGAAEDPTFCLQVLPDGEDNNYATIILTIIRYVIQM